MTLISRRLGAVLVSSLAALLAAGTLSAPADAASRDLKPIIMRYNARIEACKVFLDDGARIRVYARLDNTQNSGRDSARSGGLFINRDGEPTGKGFQLPVTPGGTTSRTKSVTFSAGGAITFDAGIGASQMGDGATFRLRRIQPC